MAYLRHLLLAMSIICFSTALPTDFDYDCKGLPESFLYWWACGSYGICRGGRYSQIDCINGTSYDRRSGDCIHNSQAVTYPCNSVPEDCLIYKGPGLRYPDRNPDPVEALPPCTFYYTCAYGRYLGHQRCPEGTVYDEPQQRCLPASQVLPPCGHSLGNDGSSFQGDVIDGRQVIQPQTDNFGNVDKNRWPFTNTRNSRNPRSSQQRLVYRSADHGQDLNKGHLGDNVKDLTSSESDSS